jgi:cell division transport system permease protein
MRQIFYCMESTWENMAARKVMSLISALTVGIFLTLPGFFILFYDNLEGLFIGLRGNIQLLVYLDDHASAADIGSIRERISAERGVKQVSFTTKEVAREEFGQMGIDDYLIGQLEENPFPASFAVTLRPDVQEDERYLSNLADRWGKLKGVEEVQYGAEWLSFLNLFLKRLRQVGTLIGLFLGGIVVTLIAATIRLNYYARQGEMEILRMIGASRGFIRVPYILEGCFLGAIASAVSIVLLRWVFHYLENSFSVSGGWMGVSYQLHFFPILTVIVFFLGGAFLGGLGSMISLALVDREQA